MTHHTAALLQVSSMRHDMKRAIESCSNRFTNIIVHRIQCMIDKDDIRSFMRLKSGSECPTARCTLSYIHARFAMQYRCSVFNLGLNDTHLRCPLFQPKPCNLRQAFSITVTAASAQARLLTLAGNTTIRIAHSIHTKISAEAVPLL